jgi:predicted patatin/cPLA2 family phospholipase
MKNVIKVFIYSKNRQKSQKHRIDMGIFSLDRFFPKLSNDIKQHRVSYNQFRAIILQREKRLFFEKVIFL